MSETPAMEDRERELRGKIARAHSAYMRAFQEEIAPWLKELAEIALCKPPGPFILGDGRTMEYIGPLPTWTPDGIKWP